MRFPAEALQGDRILQSISHVDVPLNPETVISDTDWETMTIQDGPVAGVIAHWGHEMSNKAMIRALQVRGIDVSMEYAQQTGFESRYIYPTNLSLPQIADIEDEIGTQLILNACEAREIDPDQLSRVYMCNTIPGDFSEPDDFFGERTAGEAGAHNAHVVNVSLACNGTVQSLCEVAKLQDELDGQFVFVGSVEGLTKCIGDWKGGTAENGRLEKANVFTFTNGAGGIVFQVGRDFRIVPGPEMVVVPDDKGVLRAPLGYTYEPNQPNGLMIGPNCIRQKLPSPLIEGDTLAYMDPELTMHWGGEYAPKYLNQLLRVVDPRTSPEEMLTMLSHYPSKGMMGIVLNRLKRQKFDTSNLEVPALITDGNCSSAVFLQQLLRATEANIVKAGGKYPMFGFGLGATFSGGLLDVSLN